MTTRRRTSRRDNLGLEFRSPLAKGSLVFHGTAVRSDRLGHATRTLSKLKGPAWVTDKIEAAIDYSETTASFVGERQEPHRLVAVYEIVRAPRLVVAPGKGVDAVGRLAAILGAGDHFREEPVFVKGQPKLWNPAFLRSVCAIADGWWWDNVGLNDIMICKPSRHLKLMHLMSLGVWTYKPRAR